MPSQIFTGSNASIWSKVTQKRKKKERLQAAIAYVTQPHLDFHKGDLLICDASDKSIESRRVSRDLLKIYLDRGVDLYSRTALHAKVCVFGRHCVIGSANISNNTLCEVSLCSTDPFLTSQISQSIAQIKDDAVKIDQAFLDRISLLTIKPNDFPEQSSTQIASSIIDVPRVWLVSVRPLQRVGTETRKLIDAGERKAAKAQKQRLEVAQRSLGDNEDQVKSNLSWVRLRGISKAANEISKGDLLISVDVEKKGTKYRCATAHEAHLLLNVERWQQTNDVVIHFATSEDEIDTPWKQVRTYLKSFGVNDVGPSTARELTGQARSVVEYLQNH